MRSRSSRRDPRSTRGGRGRHVIGHGELGAGRRIVLGVTALVVACATQGAAQGAPPVAGEHYHDPFAYCAAVGTVDAPDARYTGPALPTVIARGLQQAFGVASTEPLAPFERGTSWRCMDGAVYACNVGANLPCDAKPVADPQPSDGLRAYCKDDPDADFVPMYVTGHDTLYAWSCAGGAPRRGARTGELDARGYLASIWHRITPPR